MSKAEFHLHVGEENILPNVEAALTRAAALHGRNFAVSAEKAAREHPSAG
jgi:hypothetical protein